MIDMLGRGEAVSVEEALKIIALADIVYTDTEEIDITKYTGYERILASDIFSPEDLPGFPRSTMDGYALRGADTFGASETLPVYLTIKDEVFIGRNPGFYIMKGEVAKIPTGGKLPDGADSVIMFEHVQATDSSTIEIMKSVAPGENVIQVGEDTKKGELILERGHTLRPQDIGALAGLGIASISVYKTPIVAVISTGDEIAPPDKSLNESEVRDINSYNLCGLIHRAGAAPLMKGICKDDYNLLKAVVTESLSESDLVIISGGSSVGVKDITAKVIDEFGDPGVMFHGVNIKPGKPVLMGMANKKPVFGLPGHPAAVTVSFDVFVKPAIKKISGSRDPRILRYKNRVNAKITKNLSSAPGREDRIRVRLFEERNELRADPVLGKSGLVSTLVKADGVITLSANMRGLKEGDEVSVMLF